MNKKSNVIQFINIIEKWKDLSDDELRSELSDPIFKYFEDRLKGISGSDPVKKLKPIFEEIQHLSKLNLGAGLEFRHLEIWPRIKLRAYEQAIKKCTDLPILSSYRDDLPY